ncbi:MAG: FAD-dependent oxidoreductase [Inquilinus sp.]|nr:FAD-dependent oxidoreductase [Inquilinus sp.]
MRAIVVGAGIMGLSTAWALSRRGCSAVVVEQHQVPNPLGSSVDQHRLIRYSYGAQASYTAMVADAYAAWDRLWADLGRSLYVDTGTLCIGAEGHGWLNDSAATLERRGDAVEWLSQTDLARRFPLLRLDPRDRAFLLPSGGVLLATGIVEALARYLPVAGVAIRAGSAAVSVDPERATVTLDNGEILSGDHVVVAAGPWVGRLLPELAGRVTPSRQVLTYLYPPPDQALAWSRMPMVLDIDPAFGFYLVPPVGGTLMKVGDHSFSLTGDPDRDRQVADAETASLLEGCARRLAGFDRYRPGEAKSCFYTVEAEERFVVEPIGAAGWVMTGFSGHGFKFGALMGEAVAETLTGDRSPTALPRWAAGHDPQAPEGPTA